MRTVGCGGEFLFVSCPDHYPAAAPGCRCHAHDKRVDIDSRRDDLLALTDRRSGRCRQDTGSKMIHFHGMSNAGGLRDQIRLASGRNVFVSYQRNSCLPLIAAVCSSFALDNGAYSAWRSGVEFDWSGFASWAREWCLHPAFDFLVIPDEISGNGDQNDQLISKFKDALGDVDAAPVWHPHESLDRLDRLVDEYRLVCIGGSPEFPSPNTEKWWVRMHEAFCVICDADGRPRSKIHGLRMLDPRIFHRLPLRSADSTYAERAGLYEQHFGRYTPPTRGQRAEVVANRIESTQSSAILQTHEFIGGMK